MDYKIDEINPGEQIFELLKSIIPQPHAELNDVDYYFKEDGRFNEVNYRSCVYYILRRLVKTANYFRKKGNLLNNYSNEDLSRDLRIYLSDHTRFEKDDVEKLIILLSLCLTYNNSTPPSTRIRKMINKAIEDEIPCYICGSLYIDYIKDDEETDTIATLDKRGKLKVPEVEHLWPRSMGGSNQEFNLKVACKKCNGAKESFIDSADFHFEHISYDSADINDDGNTEIKFQQKVALWAKEGFKCVICGQSAEEVGPLSFRRNDETDSWHYLNISAFCKYHS